MEIVYAAMLLHKAGKDITEANVKKIVDAAGLKVEDAQIKALVAALDGVDIEKVIKDSSLMNTTAPVATEASAGDAKKEDKKEEKKEEKVDEEKATAGLGALFG